MKGTAVRASDREDESGAKSLRESPKDRAENVMIVDLVRNDLSVVCKGGSVRVEQLFEVLHFPSVYQMISTVIGELRQPVSFSEIMKATYPMGSMTGAPKKRVMQLIDQYEPVSRGIFSGCVGYIAPGGDFDFNVIIRSIMYNGHTGYLSYQVGSGITVYSDAVKEWEECLLKAEAIKRVLGVRSDDEQI
jgi:para-aminobenzoate synthetase component 1